MIRNKQPDHYHWLDLKGMMATATAVNEQVVAWLEQREAEWTHEHGRRPPTAEERAKEAREREQSHAMVTTDSEYGVGELLDGYGEPSPPSSPKPAPVRPEPVKSPSGGPMLSIAERMAALRVKGVAGATPVAFTSRQFAASVSTQPRPSSSSGRSTPPPREPPPAKPLKPAVLSPGRTPPASPRAKNGDLVEDNAVERTGSAPTVLPYSTVQDSAKVWEKHALQFQQGGTRIAAPEEGPGDRGPAGGVGAAPESRQPHSELSEPPTPTTFVQSFPTLDDFEKQADESTHSNSAYALPNAPTFDPASAPTRRPPPHPPKPPLLDKATFEREQRERAEAMAALAAGLNGPASYPSSAPSRPGLPSSLVPGDHPPSRPISQPAPPPSASSPVSPPTAASSKGFSIPFSTEVRPLELFQYLQTAKAEMGHGPRVLLLDVRSREEYEAGRIKGETVCLEPIILRDGARSNQIEDALSLSPPHEASLFASRHFYDIVIVYDRSSTSLPTSPATSTSSDAQRVLWNLTTAIYEREFSKSLKRQPLLLRGGWEAWEKQVGAKGSVGTSVQAAAARQRDSREDPARVDAKKANRRVAVLPAATEMGGAIFRNGAGTQPFASPPITANHGSYFSPTSSYSPSFSNSTMPAGLVSPRLARPPVAVQRSGSIPEYDPFAPLSAQPSYPQPHLNGYRPPASSDTGSPIAVPRTRSDMPDLSAYARGSIDYGRSSFDYNRPPIDYPQLHSRPPPPTNSATRPPTRPPPVPFYSPAYSPVSAVPLTRPPLAKPAPMRSNSSFSSMHLPSYSSAHSQFPTNMSFDDNIIGLSGLKNLGNTCYMNSTIQCLSAAIPFARYFKNGAYRKDINEVNPLGTKGALAYAVGELIRALWSQQYIYLSPVSFREAICRVAPQFRGSDQHDAQEFLGFLLDGLHEDCNYVVKKPPPIEMTPEREHDLETLPPQIMSEREWQIYKMRNDSFIVQCFQGQFRNQLRCLTCHKTSTTYNTFMPLSVPIPQHRGLHKVTLMSCLEAFVRDEILDKDDAWFCPRCKKNRKATKKLSLSKLPPILVIHLKRFSFHGPFSDKIETQVQYPLSGLDLTHFVPPPLMDKRGQAMDKSPPGGFVYDLFGVTNHYGNLSSGHYTAYVRSGRDWFNIGDSKVTACDPAVVQSAKSAYILYYAMR
ncbi:hypothetical protein JCM1841_004431 [Sporobolomyces salmonicolor]